MVLTRTFDAKAIALRRTERLGTYASSLGQEPIAVGVAAAMKPEDVLLPSFREHGAQFWRGVSPKELFLYWGGDEWGNDFKGPREDFPNCVPVGSHLTRSDWRSHFDCETRNGRQYAFLAMVQRRKAASPRP